MQITGTREAFIELVSQRGFAGKSGLDKTLVSLWSSGKRVPTLDKMEEVLVKFGASVVQERVWEVPEVINYTNDMLIVIDNFGVIPETRTMEINDNWYPYRAYMENKDSARIQIDLSETLVFTIITDPKFLGTKKFYDLVIEKIEKLNLEV